MSLTIVDPARLLRLDEELREEADTMLKVSGLGELVQAEGYEAVGSYVMQTMTWRDLDFERTATSPDWGRHWDLGARLSRNPWVWQFRCLDAYRLPGAQECGHYWGLEVCDPAGGPVWKLDLWTARAEEFAAGAPQRGRWAKLLCDEKRLRILAIKEAVCVLPEYRNEMLSVHIYEAVLDHGVPDANEFLQWWRRKVGRAQ